MKKSDGGPVVKKVGMLTLSAELKLLLWGLFTWFNCQNNLLEDLLKVKTQEVMLLLDVGVNEMEEMYEEEGMEVDEEEVRELSTEGHKEVQELEKGLEKMEGSRSLEVANTGAEDSTEVEKGLQSSESMDSGGNGDDEMEM